MAKPLGSDSAGLMLAVDVNSTEDALRLIERVERHVDALKVGWHLVASPDGGPQAITRLKAATELPLIIDTKIFDVPHIAVATVRNLSRMGATAVTAWATTGQRTLKSVVTECHPIRLFVLTGFTSDEPEDAARAVERAVHLVTASDCQDVQVPGNHLHCVRFAREHLPTACIVACGIGAQGGEVGEAIAAGANYEIIGRDIVSASAPDSVAARYQERIYRAWSKRQD